MLMIRIFLLQLTFLEFYEIILEAARQLLSLKKRFEKKNEVSRSNNNLQEKGSGIGHSNPKEFKTKNRNVT